MKLSSNIKNKMFALLFLVGLIPFILSIIIFSFTMVKNSTDSIRKNSLLKNSIMDQRLTDYIDTSFTIIRNFGVNPATRNYIMAYPDERDESVSIMLEITNGGFHDNNNMSIVAADGMQIARSDKKNLMDVSDKDYFIKAMRDNCEQVSDVLTDVRSGVYTVVLAAPIIEMSEDSIKQHKDSEGLKKSIALTGNDAGKYIIGLVQREYEISVFQSFVNNLAEKNMTVLLLDKDGKKIADSGIEAISKEENRVDTNNILNAINNTDPEELKPDSKTQMIDLKMNDKKSLVCFTKNDITGWYVVTIHPYSVIYSQVLSQAASVAIFGAIIVFIIIFGASFVSERSTRSLRAFAAIAEAVSNGNDASEYAEELSDDEIGKMADAFIKLSRSRDTYKIDAEMDQLTLLYNKATTEKACRIMIHRNNPGTLAALYVIDLDNFKEVNDTLGHQVGDYVLREFADNLKNIFRPTDCLGRFGGDEFIVMISDIPGVEIIFEKARQISQIASEITYAGKNVGITASIGIATTPKHGQDYDSLFKSADRSLYKVKQSGRNGFCYGENEITHV